MIRLLPIAYRNLRRNVRRTLFTFSAIAVGAAMLIFLDAVNRGVMNMLMEGFVEARLGAIQIHKAGYRERAHAGRLLHLNFTFDEALRAQLEAVPGVVAAAGRIHFAGQLSNGESQANVTAIAVEPVSELEVCPHFKNQLHPGSAFFPPGTTDRILMTRELGVSLSQNEADPGRGLEGMNLVATGPSGRNNSLDVGLQGFAVNLMPGPLPRRSLTIPLELAQNLLGMEGQVTEVAIRVADYERLGQVKTDLARVLGEGFEIHDWRDLAPEISDISYRQGVILGIVSALLLALVVFGITNTMLMCVRERIREIGTMTAIGTSPVQVLTIFAGEAAMMGLFGGAIGGLLGLALSWFWLKVGIPLPGDSPLFASGIRPLADPNYALQLVIGATLVAFAAGLFPAWRASLLKPVDALGTL